MPACGHLAVFLPIDGLTHVLVATGLHAPVTELLTLIDEGFARRCEQDGAGKAFLLVVVAKLGSYAVFVVVGELDSIVEAAAVGVLAGIVCAAVLVLDALYGRRQVGSIAGVDTVLNGAVVCKVEERRQTLVVGRHHVGVPVVGFTHHVDVALAAARLVGGVAVVVPLGEELHVGVGIALINPHNRIQTKAVHTQVDPLVGAGRQILEGRAVLAAGIRTVVEVGHAAGEAAEVAGAQHYVAPAVVLQLEFLTEFELGSGASPLGAVFPAGSGSAHQESPVCAHIQRELEGIGGSLVHAVAVVGEYPHLRVGLVGGLGRFRRGGNGHCHILGSFFLHGEVQAAAVGVGLVPAAHAGIVLPGEVVHSCGGGGVCEHVIVAVGRISGLGLREPLALVAGMVEHVIDVDVDILRLSGVDEFLQLRLGLGGAGSLAAVTRVDAVVVLDIVGMVALRCIDRREPQGRSS